jgi:hypothetical protein
VLLGFADCQLGRKPRNAKSKTVRIKAKERGGRCKPGIEIVMCVLQVSEIVFRKLSLSEMFLWFGAVASHSTIFLEVRFLLSPFGSRFEDPFNWIFFEDPFIWIFCGTLFRISFLDIVTLGWSTSRTTQIQALSPV